MGSPRYFSFASPIFANGWRSASQKLLSLEENRAADLTEPRLGASSSGFQMRSPMS